MTQSPRTSGLRRSGNKSFGFLFVIAGCDSGMRIILYTAVLKIGRRKGRFIMEEEDEEEKEKEKKTTILGKEKKPRYIGEKRASRKLSYRAMYCTCRLLIFALLYEHPENRFRRENSSARPWFTALRSSFLAE